MRPYFSLGDYTRKEPESGRVNLALKVSHSAHKGFMLQLPGRVGVRPVQMTSSRKTLDFRILKLEAIGSLLKLQVPNVKKSGCDIGRVKTSSLLFYTLCSLTTQLQALWPILSPFPRKTLMIKI